MPPAPTSPNRTTKLRGLVATQRANTWGPAVKARRTSLGLTLEQLGHLTDTAPQTIHKIETGALTPRDHLRYALALALMVEPGDLFPTPGLDTIRRAAA